MTSLQFVSNFPMLFGLSVAPPAEFSCLRRRTLDIRYSSLAKSCGPQEFAGGDIILRLTPSAEPWLSGECHAQFQFARVRKTHNLTSPESAIHIFTLRTSKISLLLTSLQWRYVGVGCMLEGYFPPADSLLLRQVEKILQKV